MNNKESITELHQKWFGRIIANRYRVSSILGAGGMGIVLIAEQESLNRHVAIKLIHAHLAQTKEVKTRFKQEAQVVAQINHANVIQIYDFGDTYAGELYIVSELLKGKDFTKLTKSGRICWQDALFLMRDVASGLHAAHRQGIIHRDLKPDNLMMMITADNKVTVKILDFGIAKICEEKGRQLTGSGMVLGTPGYMPPEQILGKAVDLRGDLYSAGLVFLELLLGEKIYSGEVGSAILVAQVTKQPPRLTEVVPELNIPNDVQILLDHLLAKNPVARFTDALVFMEAIDAIIAKYNLKRPAELKVIPKARKKQESLALGQQTEAYVAQSGVSEGTDVFPAFQHSNYTPSAESQQLNPTPVSAEHLQMQLSQQQKILDLQEQLLKKQSDTVEALSQQAPSTSQFTLSEQKASSRMVLFALGFFVLFAAGAFAFYQNSQNRTVKIDPRIADLAKEIEGLKIEKEKDTVHFAEKENQHLKDLVAEQKHLLDLAKNKENLPTKKSAGDKSKKKKKKRAVSSVRKAVDAQLKELSNSVAEVKGSEIAEVLAQNTAAIVVPDLNSELLQDSLFKAMGVASEIIQ